jgi:fused signal recognition particle receptor
MLNFFKKISSGVRSSAGKFFSLLLPPTVDENSIKEVENILLGADFGVEISAEIIGAIRGALKDKRELRREKIASVASDVLRKFLTGSERDFDCPPGQLQVICLVGSNGTGKTTTAAKLAYFHKKSGKKVILGSCDTFRAAANEQLSTWGQRLALEVVPSQRGGDPAAVAFDAYKAAVARKMDLLILDTAGRLHVKSNLMAELQKIFRVLGKADAMLVPNIWLVVDGTIGANTIESARTFHREIGLTGLIISKMDGTSFGGALVGTYRDLKVPIYFLGNGETPESLEKFSIEKYISRLFRGEGEKE